MERYQMEIMSAYAQIEGTNDRIDLDHGLDDSGNRIICNRGPIIGNQVVLVSVEVMMPEEPAEPRPRIDRQMPRAYGPPRRKRW